MTETTQTDYSHLLMDATMELNCILLEGTSSERLMRLYALREIIANASAETLLKIAADLASDVAAMRGTDLERKAA